MKSKPVADELAELQKALQSAEAARAAPDADMRAAMDDFRAWRQRTIADLIGLPRICAIRRCRRKRRCVADRVPCIARHRAIVADRLAVLLGFNAGDFSGDADDDIAC
jgi:hypothetical protein